MKSNIVAVAPLLSAIGVALAETKNPVSGIREHAAAQSDEETNQEAKECDVGTIIRDSETLVQASHSYPIVHTNQKVCYGDSGKISCPTESSQPYYGQDAQFSRCPPRYVDNEDGTITDKSTGLMWEKNTELVSFAEAIEGASSCTTGGYTDWRVPTIKESYSLVQFSGVDPAPSSLDTTGSEPFIDTTFFEFAYGDGTPYRGGLHALIFGKGNYRSIDVQRVSSTIYKRAEPPFFECFRGVNFADGRIKCYPAHNPISFPQYGRKWLVQYVRGPSSYGENDFKDNGDETITDRATGLMWDKDDMGPYNWEQAFDAVNDKNNQPSGYKGYTDWRIPNIKELQSIVDYSQSPATTGSPAIDDIFSTTKIVNEAGVQDYPYFWSSTTHNHQGRIGKEAAYIAFGRALGKIHGRWTDVHGAGAQRSDPKKGDPKRFPDGRGPQGDIIRIYNYIRLVRDVNLPNESK